MNDHGNGTDETPPEPGSNVAGTPANPDERPRPDNPAGEHVPDEGSAGVGGASSAARSVSPSGDSAVVGSGSGGDASGSQAGESAAPAADGGSDAAAEPFGGSTGVASGADGRASASTAPGSQPGNSADEAPAEAHRLSSAAGNTPAASAAPGTQPGDSAAHAADEAPAEPHRPAAASRPAGDTPATLDPQTGQPIEPAHEKASPAGAHAAIPPATPEEQTGPIARFTDEPAGVSSTSAESYGSENLLPRQPAAADSVAPPGKARRSPWNRGRDRVIAGAIVVVVAVVTAIVAVNSDNLHTSRALADPPHALPAPPTSVPGSMTQLWQAPSSATPIPIGQSDSVVTADGSEVAGRDPLTGQIRWHYTRENLQLCTVDTAWGRVNAVYHKSMGCSEVTQLDPATGRITAQRNGDAELGTRLINDGSHVTTTGKHLLDTWRDDLVKSMEYGKVPFLQNANKQPRPNCTYGTVAAGADKIGVIERCPGDRTDRLTVYKATAEHEDEPKVTYTALLAGKRARVIAMSGDLTGVLLPDQKLYVVYGADGSQKAAYPMDLPAADTANDPVGGTEATTRTAAGIYWYTGSKTVALSRDDLSPRWTLDGTLGPGITFATQLVVPIRGGLAVLNEMNGATLRTVGIDRGAYTGPVRLTALGPVLLEQRGPTLAALR